MPIPFQCPHCGVTGNAKEKHLGRIVACPKCGEKVEVGAEPPSQSNRAVRAFGSMAFLAVAVVAGLLLLSLGESNPPITESPIVESPVQQPETPEPATTEQASPFEFKVLNETWTEGVRNKSVKVEVQVADDVAPTVTEADLKAMAPIFMKKYGGAPFGIYFSTVTPLSQPWGRINYNPHTRVGDVLEVDIMEYAFEFGPWYFPDKIDRNTKWHEIVWLTLPKVNKIVNGATEYQWEITSRSANNVSFESKVSPIGKMKDHMRLSPQTWEISTYDGDVPRFVRSVESSLNHLDLELSENIVGKLNSVIGVQAFLTGEKSNWTWMIGRLEVTYFHYENSDMVTIIQSMPESNEQRR